MSAIILTLLTVLVIVPVAVLGIVYIIVPVFKAIGWSVRHVTRFIAGEIGDFFRIFGSLVTAIVLGLMVIMNIIVGRWSASAHFGRAVQAEGIAMGTAIYRMLIGHPARFLMLTAFTEGLERRLPAVVAAAPAADGPYMGGWIDDPSHEPGFARHADGRRASIAHDGTPPRPRTRSGKFNGYTIVGSLPGGGSGGKLYIAEPDAIKQASFERAGHREINQVVIKTFSLQDGSSLPQIVRESRSLDAARRLGLVLDHELNDERFFYVMRYVPGESLALVTQRLHAVSDHSAGDGLDDRNLRLALSYAADLLRTLDVYHRGGLWHKDVKPDNIIVDRQSAHLVDFGLVTPLRSAMTLTTHGTEYFRDPELVRMALKGVKVHQVDGAKFDIYAAGAVLFSMIENSFPAHGGLSQISKRCPEALRWIVRRAMTEYDKRYTSAAAMLHDLAVVQNAPDPFAVRPADLPSMNGGMPDSADAQEHLVRPAVDPISVGDGSGEAQASPGPQVRAAAFAGSPVPPPSGERRPPKIRVRDWWTGGFIVEDPAPARAIAPVWHPRNRGVPAQEQLRSARARAADARQRAAQRISRRRASRHREFSTFNTGVSASLLVFMAVCMLVAAFMVMVGRNRSVNRIIEHAVDTSALFAQGQLPEGSLAAIAGDALRETSVRQDRPPTRIVVQGASTPPALAPAASSSASRILIVSDTQPLTQPVLSALERLATTGFLLMGNFPGNPADDEEMQHQLLLEAEAKLTRELGPLDAPDVSLTLSEWVATRDDVDLLVWFARSGEQDSPMRYWLYRAPTDPTDPQEEVELGAFQAAVQALGGAASIPQLPQPPAARASRGERRR